MQSISRCLQYTVIFNSERRWNMQSHEANVGENESKYANVEFSFSNTEWRQDGDAFHFSGSRWISRGGSNTALWYFICC